MKYLLTPFTMLLWFIITYFSLVIVLISLIFIFSLGWFWIIMGASFLTGIIYTITASLLLLLNNYIVKFYGYNWFSIITHSTIGLIAFIVFIIHYLFEPYDKGNGQGEVLFYTEMWDISPLITILFTFTFLGNIIAIFYSMIIAPYIFKSSEPVN